MRRRAVLSFGAAALAGSALRAQAGRNFAVIGAGMAGLAAASALQAAGATALVLEARNRIGGRLWTDRSWPDLPVDVGASWIHGTKGNPLTKLADQADLSRVATSYDSAAAFAEGAEVDFPAEPWDMLEAAQEAAYEAPSDISLMAAVTGLADWTRLSTAEKSALRAAVHRAVEHEYAGDWAALSARHFDATEEFKGKDVLFPGGYDQLATHVARALNIRTYAKVTALRARPGGVEINMADGSRLEVDGVVLTVPLGVLKAGDITFDPPLAPSRQTAIEQIGMGLLNKCWLRFDRSPPVPAVDWIENLGPTAPLWAEWLNPGAALAAPVLLGFNAADTADAVEALSNADTIASATETLRQMFGSAFPDPLDAQISRWRADPLARGSYSFAATGTGPDARQALGGSEWDGQLVFAGEATSVRHAATVHGAWLSGLDAAKALR